MIPDACRDVVVPNVLIVVTNLGTCKSAVCVRMKSRIEQHFFACFRFPTEPKRDVRNYRLLIPVSPQTH